MRSQISPINGQQLWPKTDAPQILPPIFKTPPRRPRKLRRREPDEDVSHSRLGKKHLRMKCSNCDQFDHNIRSCKQGKTNKVNIVYYNEIICHIFTNLELITDVIDRENRRRRSLQQLPLQLPPQIHPGERRP